MLPISKNLTSSRIALSLIPSKKFKTSIGSPKALPIHYRNYKIMEEV